MKKTIIIFFIYLTWLTSTMQAGSTAAAFMENPVSVRSIALGNCSAAQVDSSSFYNNPASVKAYKNQSINVFQGKVLNDVNYLSLNYAKPNADPSQYGLGFSLLQAGTEGIQEATYDSATGTAELTGNKFSYLGRAYLFSISKGLADNFFIGTNIKYIQESLATESSSGVGLDLGVLALINNKLSIGISAINIIKPQLHWSTGMVEPMNSKYITGISYQYNDSLQLFSDLEKVEDQPSKLILGAEYKILSICSFRAGYHNSQITVGTGLEYNNINIDYAYVDNHDKDLGVTQYISLSLLLNDHKDTGKQEQKVKNDQALKDAIAEEKLKAELKKINPPKIPTKNSSVTAAAEIKPLPLPEPEAIAIEQVTISIIPTASMTTAAITEVIEPIIETSIEKELTINIQDEPTEPVFDYTIALISARYYETSKLQCKVFIDNTGNQNDTISVNFRILNKDQKELSSFESKSAQIAPKNNSVYYFVYSPGNPLSGTYYLETKTQSSSTTKYQKEIYIKRE